jgi:hypothetical protein
MVSPSPHLLLYDEVTQKEETMTKTITFPRKLGRPFFEQWLEAKMALNKYVGVTNDPCQCPFARFMMDNGYKEPDVSDADIGHYSDEFPNGVYFLTPKWLTKFIQKVDLTTGSKVKKIHSKTAVNIINSI